MGFIPDSPPDVSPVVATALLLAARRYLAHYQLPTPTAKQVLEATGASRSRAYELANDLVNRLPELSRPVGRPKQEAKADAPAPRPCIQDDVIEFLATNPGSMYDGERNHYELAFRHFIVQLYERYSPITLPAFAQATHVPVGTIRDWLRQAKNPSMESNQPASQDSTERSPSATSASAAQDSEPEHGSSWEEVPADDVVPPEVTDARIQAILNAKKHWKGSFVEFCKHVEHGLRIPYKRTRITKILTQYGMYKPARRAGRSRDELALKGAFETFFPGAQWVGDGHELAIELNGTRYTFNLELNVDADSGALIGVHLSDEEDSEAVCQAFKDGVHTGQKPPLALLLDNRSCNHTEDVNEATGETLLIRATLGRAQNKAHVEGAFGLFEQIAPPLQLCAQTPRELAAGILERIIQVWARTLNHKPRRGRANRSRAELYRRSDPTPEQIQEAREALRERQRRQDKAYQTRVARQNPVARKLLEDAFTELPLIDPDGNVELTIAAYPLDVIVEGVAIFKAKKSSDTLPEGANARYLLGIVKNLSSANEHLHMTEELLRLRLDVRDWMLESLRAERDTLLKYEEQPTTRIDLFVDRALETDCVLARLFWLRSAAEVIIAHSAQPLDYLRRASNRIRLTYRATTGTREEAIRFLIRIVLPIDSSTVGSPTLDSINLGPAR